MSDRLVIGIDGAAAVAAAAEDRCALVVRNSDEMLDAIADCDEASVYAFCPASMLTIGFIRRATAAARAANTMLGIQPVGPEYTPDPTVPTIPEDPARSIVMYSDEVDGKHVSGRISFIGRPASLPDELAGGAAAIVMYTHGNGVDYQMGSDVLCVQSDAMRPSPPIDAERCFPCQAGGACLREVSPVRRYFGALALRAPAVVMLSCTGLVPANGIVDFRFGLVPALLRAGVRSIVASFQVHSMNLAIAFAAVRYLDSGATVGRLAAMLDEVVHVPSYVCIGDPDLSLEPARREGTITLPPRRVRAAFELPVVDLTQQHPRRRFHAQFVRRLNDDQLSPPAVAKTASLACALEIADASDTDVDRRLVGELAAGAARGTILFKDWQRDLPLGPNVDTGELHTCGERLLASHATSPRFPGVARTVWICERCGHVADAPSGTRLLPVAIERDRARLDASSDLDGGWIAWTVEPVGRRLEPVRGPHRITRDGGAIALPIDVVHPEPGLRYLTAVIGWRGDFMVIRHPIEAT